MACRVKFVVFGLSVLGLGACNTTQNRGASQVLDASAGAGTGTATFAQKSMSDLSIVATINSGGDWMCFGFGSLWEPSGGSITRVDPTQHAVVAQVPASVNWCAPAPSGNYLWGVSCYDQKIYKIDTTTNTVAATYSVPVTGSSEGSFAVTDDSVWVITSNGGTNSGTLSRVDATTGQVKADIKVTDDSHGIAALGGYVWVTSLSGNTVTQVDMSTNTVVRTIPVDAGPNFIAAGQGGVWALSQSTQTVAHIDPATGKLVAEIATGIFPGGGGDIVAGEGGVWVAQFSPTLTQIDPTANKVVAEFTGSGFGDAVRAGGGYLWVSGGQLSQITPPTFNAGSAGAAPTGTATATGASSAPTGTGTATGVGSTAAPASAPAPAPGGAAAPAAGAPAGY